MIQPYLIRGKIALDKRSSIQPLVAWHQSWRTQGMVSGYDLQFTSGMGRRGRVIIPKAVVRAAPSAVRNARERSLGVRGAQIFNLLPENIRSMNTDHVDFFKNHLDVFLSSIPDQSGKESKCLLHQLPMFYTRTV